MRDTKNDILKFWFEDSEPKQWFEKNDDFDQEITSRFMADYELAMNDIYNGWGDSADGCLALIILFDQFPRNMFRNTPRMFASDYKALEIANTVLDKKFDTDMDLHQKVFSYLPFEHSEDMADQQTSLKLFKNLQDVGVTYYDYAKQHHDVIKKFGRFPHRNKILGRHSTKLEEEYLAKPGSGF